MSSILNDGKLPAGFKSPFTRVPMEGTHDDQLACIATLTGKTLANVKAAAHLLGLPANGPFWVDDAMVQKLLWNLSDLMASDWIELTCRPQLPDVAILCVDFNPETEIGRHVVHHNVKGLAGVQPFGYVIDVGNWVDPKRQITTDTSGLKLSPSWYREISRRPGTGNKPK
ncbi:MAG: hypothetical protein J0L58_10650 [Burkholderiales bacterium]|nr:hypothetical protein [Burkholderiales bacterium]